MANDSMANGSTVNYTYAQSNFGLAGADSSGYDISGPPSTWPDQTLNYTQLTQCDDYNMRKIAMVAGAQMSDPAGTSTPVALDGYIGADSGAGRRQPSQPPVGGSIGSTDLY